LKFSGRKKIEYLHELIKNNDAVLSEIEDYKSIKSRYDKVSAEKISLINFNPIALKIVSNDDQYPKKLCSIVSDRYVTYTTVSHMYDRLKDEQVLDESQIISSIETLIKPQVFKFLDEHTTANDLRNMLLFILTKDEVYSKSVKNWANVQCIISNKRSIYFNIFGQYLEKKLPNLKSLRREYRKNEKYYKRLEFCQLTIVDFVNLKLELNPMAKSITIPYILSKLIGFKKEIEIVAKEIIVLTFRSWFINSSNQISEEMEKELKKHTHILLFPADTSPAVDTYFKLTLTEEKEIIKKPFNTKKIIRENHINWIMSQMKNYSHSIPDK